MTRPRAEAMVAHGVITKAESCDRKTGYSRNEARHRAKIVARRTNHRTTTYKCAFCGQYHVAKIKFGEEAA